MDTGFKDPLKIKKQYPEDKPKEGKNSPWGFRCPQYDERSSCYMNAGTDYGVGHKQPIGHEGNPKENTKVLPKGRIKTLDLYPKK